MAEIQDVASVLEDEAFLEKVFSKDAAAGAIEKFHELTSITEDRKLAILSLPHVRNMILDKIDIK